MSGVIEFSRGVAPDPLAYTPARAANLDRLDRNISAVSIPLARILGQARFTGIMAASPAIIGASGALVYAGGDFIYAFQGGTNAFWRYSISLNTWLTMAASPANIGAGGDLVYAGGDFIYAFQGGTNAFWRAVFGNDPSWQPWM